MKKSLSFIAINLFLFAITGFTQASSSTDYVVLVSGDTLRGVVDFRNWESRPTSFLFTKTGATNSVVYTPSQVKYVAAGDQKYEGAVVELDKSSTRINEASLTKELELVKDTVFLRTEISGSKNLLMYKDRNGISHFFIKRDNKYEWLVYKISYDNDNSGTPVKNTTYIDQLQSYLADCSSLKDIHVDYNLYSLTQLFQQYLNCTHAPLSFTKEAKMVLKAGVMAGTTLSQIKFSDDVAGYYERASYNTSVSFAGGLFLDLIVPHTQNKLVITNELVYTSFKIKGSYRNYTNENIYSNYQMQFNYSYLKLLTMLSFKPVRKLDLSVDLGVSNATILQKDNSLKQQSKFYATTHTDEGPAIIDSKKYVFGTVGGLGLKISKLSVRVRYEMDEGFIGYKVLTVSNKVNRAYLLFGYTF